MQQSFTYFFLGHLTSLYGPNCKLLEFIPYPEIVRKCSCSSNNQYTGSSSYSATILCKGLPGVGKSWVIKTLRNITRRLHGMDSDMATTPTGCSAFQIDGSTHYRKHTIPAEKKTFNKAPCNVLNTVSNKIRAIRAATSKVISRFMDKHSMSG